MTRMWATRRALLKAASAFASLLLAPVPFLTGQTASPTAAPTPAPTPSPSVAEGPKGLAAAARERYGKFLAPEEFKMLDEEMGRSIAAAAGCVRSASPTAKSPRRTL